jgi:hypothetical protein
MAVMAASLMLPSPCRYALFCLFPIFVGVSSTPAAGAPTAPVVAPGTENPTTPRPDSHILDTGRVFAFQTKRYDSLSKKLITASENEGLEIYVAIYSFLIGESIDERAVRLRKEWLADRFGVVIVYDTSTDHLTLAATEDYQNFLPQVELMHLFGQAANSAREYKDASGRIAAVVDTMLTQLPSRLQKSPARQPLFDRQTIHFGIGLLGTLLALSAAGAMLLRLQRRADSTTSQFYYFPRVHVQPRFGAPNGGGAIGELHFATANHTANQHPPEPRPPDKD